MNPIFDTAMLKHHRVDYDRPIDTLGARRQTHSGRTFTFVTIAVLGVGLLTSFIADSQSASALLSDAATVLMQR
ncbi:hypothetical protein [Sulfitobacter sp. SK012]|uniref:hypothetical protein n=1 Tax=Sulfitobacter sp. SK012 TaxID=1389005 RepID=UPI0013B38BE3|nr:hypothetical protein [Sulfitobacter sp. SK012]